MILSFVYSNGSDNLRSASEERKRNLEFFAASDKFVPEEERSYNLKYQSLDVLGEKIGNLNEINPRRWF